MNGGILLLFFIICGYFPPSGHSPAACAGAGSGVLFVDMSGAGRSSEAGQIEFAKWDPTATGDLQALADVFDTNHNGKLDAGDAAFANCYVQRVNADGTATILSLARLGTDLIDLDGDCNSAMK